MPTDYTEKNWSKALKLDEMDLCIGKKCCLNYITSCTLFTICSCKICVCFTNSLNFFIARMSSFLINVDDSLSVGQQGTTLRNDRSGVIPTELLPTSLPVPTSPWASRYKRVGLLAHEM